MKKFTLLLGLIVLSFVTTFAQETHLRNSKWFTYNTQINFGMPASGGSPQADDNPIPISLFGYVLASVCDQNGDPLIAVTSSGWVWANGGIGLISLNSWNVTIVPRPNHSDRYYVIASGINMGLSYTEVDLVHSTLINPNTPLNDLSGVPITSNPGGSGVASTVHSNGTDYWVTAFANDNLMSYLVTADGINTTPISAFGLTPSDYGGTFKVKISPQTDDNGLTAVAVANNYTGASLINFDNATGELTENNSDTNFYLQQIGLYKYDYWVGLYLEDVEFSADGNTVYCVDGFGYDNDFYNGSTYAVSGSSETMIDEYGTFTALQRGPDGNLYFIGGDGEFYRSDNNGYSYPQNAGTPYNTGIRLWPIGNSQRLGHLPQLVSFNNCFATATTTPTFNIPSYICKNTTVSLPTTSNEGITGSWSSDFDSTTTKTYTFTADPGLCVADTATLTVTVNDQNTIPSFDLPTSMCSGSSYTLSTTSSNGITGTWSQQFNNMATTTYTFTPDNAQCGTTFTTAITINPIVVPTFNPIAPICSGGSFTLPTISTNTIGITGTWWPTLDNTATTSYLFISNAGQCANNAAMTVVVNPIVTPTFTTVAPINAGDNLAALPTISTNTTGITGIWSPALSNTVTNTYTFTPTTGQCANTTTMTVTVNPPLTAPVFNDVTMIGSGSSINYTFPTSASNNSPITNAPIHGTWSPAQLVEGDNTYTFTPDAGQYAATTTMSFLYMMPTAIEAIDDDFTITAPHLAVTPSVLTNDLVNDLPFTSGSATASFVKFEGIDGTDLWPDDEYADYNLNAPNYPSLLTPDGIYHLPYYFPTGTYLLTYTITSSCSGRSDTGTAIIRYGNNNGTIYGKKVQNQEQEQLTDTIPVYPNPSTGIFNIDLTAVKGDYDTVQVFNMLGEIVYEGSLQTKTSNSIDLSSTATGFYIAKVSGNSGSSAFQLIKQ